MTKNSPKPTPDESAATTEDAAQNGAADTPAEGVYQNPSFKTRFQKGVSGNPSGRKKGSLNKSKIVEKALNKKVTVREGGRSSKSTKFEVFVDRLTNDCVMGNHKAIPLMLSLIKTFNLVDKLPELDIAKPLIADGDAFLLDYVSRLGVETPSASPDKGQIAVKPSKPEAK